MSVLGKSPPLLDSTPPGLARGITRIENPSDTDLGITFLGRFPDP